MSLKNIFFPILPVLFVSFLWASCKKKSDAPAPIPPYAPTYPKNYTAHMGGYRTWLGTYEWGFGGPGPQNDTQHFAVTIYNDSTIIIQGDTLNYKYYTGLDSSMYFDGSAHFVSGLGTVSATYYFTGDSLSYYKYSRPTLCCFTKYDLHAK